MESLPYGSAIGHLLGRVVTVQPCSIRIRMEVLRAPVMLRLPFAAFIPRDLEDVAFRIVQSPHMLPATPRA